MAEVIFRRLLARDSALSALGVAIRSRGLSAPEGGLATHFAMLIMVERGLSLEEHRAHALSAASIEEADLVLAMEARHKERVLGDFSQAGGKLFTLAEYIGGGQDVADPSPYGFVDEFRRCADLLEDYMTRLADRIKRDGGFTAVSPSGGKRPRKLSGTVFSGQSQGVHFTGLDWVQEQWRTKLGFTPHPGTFNIRLRPEDHGLARSLGEGGTYIEIVPPSPDFCPARCYRVSIGETKGAIVRPVVPGYPDDVIEVLAPVNLRQALSTQDGDEVTVTLEE